MNQPFSIRQRALELGFDDCRIARSRELTEQRERLSEWLSSGRYGGLHYMQRNVDKRIDPGLLMEGTRSVIVCAMGYKRAPAPQPFLNRIASYAWGKDYHLVIREKLKQLLHDLQTAYPGSAGRVFVDTAPLLEKAWAVEAGLGWIGRNSLLIHPVLGSYLLLGVILTTVELPARRPDKRQLWKLSSLPRRLSVRSFRRGSDAGRPPLHRPPNHRRGYSGRGRRTAWMDFRLRCLPTCLPL